MGVHGSLTKFNHRKIICYLKSTKIPDFPILWMFIISEEYSITLKTKVCNTILNSKNIKQNEKSKIKNRNKSKHTNIT